MVACKAIAQKRRSDYWTIHFPKSIAATQPRFKVGEWVPLGEYWQRWENVTVYGQICGLCHIDGEWSYLIAGPDDHPCTDDIDTANESELIARAARMGDSLAVHMHEG